MPVAAGLSTVLFVEVALFGGLCYLLAGLVLRLFRRAPERFVAPLIAATVISLLCLSSFEIYRTPHSSSGTYSNLAGIFD